MGMTSILHTWGQNLSLHPHLHCIVPAGGLTETNNWKHTKSKGKYLFPVRAMSVVFRATFMSELRRRLLLDNVMINQKIAKAIFSKNWVVYAKKPFMHPKNVIEYLGRYSHKVAISNHRIIDCKDGKIRFNYKDYKQGGKKKIMTLDESEFIRRFAQHILPHKFIRIRHYGILSSASQKKALHLLEKVFMDQSVYNRKNGYPKRRKIGKKYAEIDWVLIQGNVLNANRTH